MKKKALFIILGVALVLVLALLILWLCMPKKPAPLNEDVDGTSYPCVVSQKDTDLLVDIDGGAEGYAWRVTDYGDNTASAVVEKSSEKGARVLVKPLMSGASCLTISLQNTANPADVRSQIFLNVMVQGDTVSLVSQTRKDFAPANENVDGAQPFTLKPMADGSYLVNVIGKPNASWSTIVSRGEATLTKQELGLDKEATKEMSVASYSITCEGEENCVLYIKDDVNGDALKIEMKYEAQTGFSPLTTEWVTLPTLSQEEMKSLLGDAEE